MAEDENIDPFLGDLGGQDDPGELSEPDAWEEESMAYDAAQGEDDEEDGITDAEIGAMVLRYLDNFNSIDRPGKHTCDTAGMRQHLRQILAVILARDWNDSFQEAKAILGTFVTVFVVQSLTAGEIVRPTWLNAFVENCVTADQRAAGEGEEEEGNKGESN